MARVEAINCEQGSSAKQWVLGLVVGAGIGCTAYFLVAEFLIQDTRFGPDSVSLPVDRALGANETESIDVSSLEEVLEGAEDVDQAKELLSRVDQLSSTQLVELIDNVASINASVQADLLQEQLLGALARTEPSRAFESIWKFPSSRWNDSLEIVMGEWAVVDLTAALRATHSLIGSMKEVSIRAILAELNDQSISSVLQIAKSLDLGSFVERSIQESQAIKLLDQPPEAWSLIVRDKVKNVYQKELLTRIAQAWILNDGFEALTRLYDDLYHEDSEFFEEMLRSVASHDPSAAFDYVVNLPYDEKQSLLSVRLLDVWAQQDAEEALQAVSRLTNGWTRSSAASNVLFTWAQNDPLGLLENVESFPRSSRQEAVRRAVRKLSASAPEQAAEQLQRLQPILGEIELTTEFALVEGWSKIDPVAAMAWVDEQAKQTNTRRSRLMQRVLARFALVDPEEAMKQALDEVTHEFEEGAERHVIDALVDHGRFEVALGLLDGVRETAKLSSAVSIARSLVRTDQADEAVKLAQQLPEENRSMYFVRLSLYWMRIDPQELMNRLATFPTQSIRSDVAQAVLTSAEFPDHNLTEEHLAQLDSYAKR